MVERTCQRANCGASVTGRADKRFCSRSCKIMESREKNYKKVRKAAPKARARGLSRKQRATLAACVRGLVEAASIYMRVFGAEAQAA